MSSMSIEQLRAAFKKPTNNTSNLPNNYYRFWDMKVGEQAEIRFLPDKNSKNAMGFVVEKKSHTLQINGQARTVPCLSMYGEECPVCNVSREYYKHDDKENGKKYWAKKQHIAQALVIDNPIPAKGDEENPQGKVRLVSLGYSLYKIIEDAFGSGELDEAPYDYDMGTNFVIKKDQQGTYASYTLSKFARRESAIDRAEVEDGMVDLSTVLPKNPGRERVEAMLEADLTGGAYEESGQSTNRDGDNDEEPRTVNATQRAERASSVNTPVVEEASSDDVDDEAERLLAAIRQRKAQQV